MTDLKTIANDVFKRFQNENKVFVTSDGQAFLNEAHAKNHAKKNRTGKELKLETFLREDNASTGSTTGDKPKTAEELIIAINAATEIEVVNAILEAEKAGKKRTTVIQAAEAKIAELTNPE